MTKIYKLGEPILNAVAEAVAPEEFNAKELETIINELNTISKELGAVGFAAPQIGYSKRVMMIGMEFKNPRRPNLEPFPNTTFVNPEVTYTSPDTIEDWEGCASIDDTLAYVSRPVMIKYRAQDPKGSFFEGELNDFRARVFLHELDHLNGILMNDRATQTKKRDTESSQAISMKSK